MALYVEGKDRRWPVLGGPAVQVRRNLSFQRKYFEQSHGRLLKHRSTQARRVLFPPKLMSIKCSVPLNGHGTKSNPRVEQTDPLRWHPTDFSSLSGVGIISTHCFESECHHGQVRPLISQGRWLGLVKSTGFGVHLCEPISASPFARCAIWNSTLRTAPLSILK